MARSGDATPLRPSDVALTFTLIVVSGNPAFSGPGQAPWILLLLALAVLAVRRGRLSIRFLATLSWVGGGFALIMALQAWQFGVFSPAGSVYLLFKIVVGGLVLAHLGPRLAPTLFRTVAWICASSLLLYPIMLALGPTAMPGLSHPQWLGENLKTLFIFTIHETPEWWRNSSMFWEPGAFQGIINLALLLMPAAAWTSRSSRFPLLLIILALGTTFSTTGYIVFFVIATTKLVRFRLSPALKLPMVAVAIAGAATAYAYADFLGEKIALQIESATSLEDFAPDRFGAMLFDVHYIVKQPLIGNGLPEESRLADHPHLHGVALGHGNGLSNFVATFGLMGVLFYFGTLAAVGPGQSLWQRLGVVAVVAMLSFGQQFLGYPLFIGLPFARQTASAAPDRSRRHLPTPSVRTA